MNLSKLFETQRVLDARIELEHPPVQGEDRLAKKILALLVELGELANEQRSWKFWSKNQNPNVKCKECRGTGYCHHFGYADNSTPCEFCEGYPERNNPLLEEYVDCLHFILSIGVEHEFDVLVDGLAIESMKLSNITNQFTALMRTDWEIYEEGQGGYYHEGLEYFVSLGEMLGFTWEQIEQAYYDKNAINHTRQNTGY